LLLEAAETLEAAIVKRLATEGAHVALTHSSSLNFKLEDFDRTLAVNVRAVFVASQAAVKHMKEGGAHHQYRKHEC
jgi:hypothetical protein